MASSALGSLLGKTLLGKDYENIRASVLEFGSLTPEQQALRIKAATTPRRQELRAPTLKEDIIPTAKQQLGATIQEAVTSPLAFGLKQFVGRFKKEPKEEKFDRESYFAEVDKIISGDLETMGYKVPPTTIHNLLKEGFKKFARKAGEKQVTGAEQVIGAGEKIAKGAEAIGLETTGKIIKGATGVLGTPSMLLGEAGINLGEDRPVEALKNIGFAAASITPQGALFNAVLAQPEVQKAAEPVFEGLENIKQQTIESLGIEDQNLKDLLGTGVDVLAFELLHRTAKGVFKKTVKVDLPNGKTIKVPVDREFWAEFKQTMESDLRKFIASPRKYFEENPPFASGIRDVSKQPLPEGISPEKPIPPELEFEGLEKKYGIYRDKNLSPEDMKVQDVSIKKFLDNPDKMIDEYISKFGKKINADNAKLLFKDIGYTKENAAAVHEAASALAREAWKKSLITNKEPIARILGGGSGAGKSTMIRTLGEEKDVAVTLDGNLSNLKSARQKITEARQAGKIPEIDYIYRNPIEAWTDGVIKRMLGKRETGRVVPIKIHVENHKGSLEVAKTLANEGKERVRLFTTTNLGITKKMSITELNKLQTPTNLDSRLRKITKDLLKEGKITQSQFNQLYGYKSPKAGKGFERKERGFITSVKEELPELKVGGQYIPRSTDRLATKARNLIKEDLATAEKMAYTGTNDKAVAVGAELLKHYTEEATFATEAVKSVLYDKAAKLANDLAHRLTEQGRSVQAASILSRLTPEGQVKFAAREIQKYNAEIEKTGTGILGLKKKIPELTKEQAGDIIKEMKEIQAMPEGREKAMRFQKLQNSIQDLVPTPLFKKIIAVWKAGLLTGLKTSGVNIFANLSHFGTEVISRIPATIVDQITSLVTKKRAVAFSLKGIPEGAKEGFKKGLEYLKTGFDERNIGTKLDYKRVNFGKGKLAKGLQAYTDTVFRIIGAEDQPYYYAAKMMSLYEQAKIGAINKGLKGKEAQKFIDELIQNPTDNMIKYASIDAETMVFQNKTLLGQAAKKIQEIPGGEIVVPFGRTPSAVATQIINYSPIGIVKTIFENVGKGKFNQRLFSQGLGRGITGTGALALGALLMSKGILSLARPRGEREQKLWELEGRQANSIKIGGKWRQIQILGPVGNLLLVGGYFQKEFNESGSPSEAMAKAMAGATLSFSQQTFLTGVSNFIDAVTDPARSAKYVAGSTLASTVPTIIADIARAIDTKERRANEIFDKFQARIPGFREKLEPQITVLGEEKETVGNPLEIMANPTRPSPIKTTPVIEELRRLWDKGFKVSPTLLGDREGYDSLTEEQNTELWKKAGEITNDKLSNLIKSEDYLELADDEKAKYIDNFVEKSKLNARTAFVLELTQGLEGDTLKARLSEFKKSGLMTREVFKKYLELK